MTIFKLSPGDFLITLAGMPFDKLRMKNSGERGMNPAANQKVSSGL